MRRSRREDPQAQKQTEPTPETPAKPRYARPKILVVGTPRIAAHLRDRGYSADSGTFGTIQTVPVDRGVWPVESSFDLPGHTEKDVVVIDLAMPTEAQPASESSAPQPGVPRLWAPVTRGTIDPRPLAMWTNREVMDRIHHYGGVFIVFTSPFFSTRYVIGEFNEYTGLQVQDEIVVSNWDLLKDLGYLSVTADSGEEMCTSDTDLAKTFGLGGYFTEGRFQCVIQPPGMLNARWVTLAVSKFGLPVAGVIFPDRDQGPKGWVFVLPPVDRSVELVAHLLDRVLPVLAPRLFPDAEGTSWTRRPEYQLPRISELRRDIAAVEEASRQRVRELEELIEAERAPYGFLDDLLTASGAVLVQAVIQTLKLIGFADVHDVDAEADAAGESGPRREDIRIMDARVPVLVEVKGINSMPSEEEAMQVAKYLRPRMKEWRTPDIHGLAVINHQRNLPALDREHDRVFQDDVLINADEQDFTLLTTWDLYRLARGFITHHWQHSDVEELFLAKGRMNPAPSHYIPLGPVAHVWKEASVIGVELANGPIQVGDRIAYELPVDFIEEEITTLQVANSPVHDAPSGTQVGIKTSSIDHLRKGTQAYLVKSGKCKGDSGVHA
jgi:hypothetical protein